MLYSIHFIRAVTAAWLCLVGRADVILAQAPAANQTENPALKHFDRSITFYASFDGTLRADLAKGKPDPTNVEGAPQFLPGLYGQAMLLNDLPKPGRYIQIVYPILDNIDVTKPGSLAVWCSPKNWVRNDQEDYFWPVNIMANNGVQLMFGRQGQLLNPTRRTDMLYLWARFGEAKGVSVIGGDSLRWKNDEWHLWVMNWRSSSVEFSMDGGALQRQDMPARISPGGDRAGNLLVGPSAPTCRYLLDELLVLDRPLSEDEIKWMYVEGMRRTK